MSKVCVLFAVLLSLGPARKEHRNANLNRPKQNWESVGFFTKPF